MAFVGIATKERNALTKTPINSPYYTLNTVLDFIHHGIISILTSIFGSNSGDLIMRARPKLRIVRLR